MALKAVGSLFLCARWHVSERKRRTTCMPSFDSGILSVSIRNELSIQFEKYRQ